MTATLYTFGYEGLSIDVFIARLKEAGVKAVFDVRQLPLSRKKGFSKNAFSIALQGAGLDYSHLVVFGCPPPVRDRYKIDGDWTRYEKAFNAYLSQQSAAISRLAELAQKTAGCLICFESDFRFCHRSLVADAASRAARLRIVHLTAKGEVIAPGRRAAA